MSVLRLFVLLLLILAPSASALAEDTPEDPSLQVGVTTSPPFTMEQDGIRSGLAVELWEAVAEDLGLAFEYQPMELAELLAATEAGDIDVGVAALTITSDRSRNLDFTHPFHATGLAIATHAAPPWRTVLRVGEALVSSAFLQVVGLLGLVLFVVGTLVWVAERRANPDEFGGTVLEGIFSGFWWSAVTMTTVGYGDKSPRTVAGRLLALVWMFVALILVSSFTAALVSAAAEVREDGRVRGVEDLGTVTTGTVEGSTSEMWLQEQRFRYEPYGAPAEAVGALVRGEVDAVVYDEPILLHLAARYDGEVLVLPGLLNEQIYAFGLPRDSDLRRALNVALLERVESRWWAEAVERYLPR